jgi:hypothetical protein
LARHCGLAGYSTDAVTELGHILPTSEVTDLKMPRVRANGRYNLRKSTELSNPDEGKRLIVLNDLLLTMPGFVADNFAPGQAVE